MGRVTYEQLRRRAAKGYAFNLEPLGTAVPIERITELLQEKIATTISDLENGPDPAQYRRIEKVYIGKTYISTKKEEPRPHTEITFEPHDPDTWKVDGISSRYNAHSRKDYGRDGMVVLCAIVNETMTEGCRVNHEQYTLAVEQKLLHHYLITHPDPRVANNTFATGGEGDDHKGYVIYMTFKYVPVAGTGASATTGGGGAGGAGSTTTTSTSTTTTGAGTGASATTATSGAGSTTTTSTTTTGASVTAAGGTDKDARRSRSSKKK